MGLHTDRIERFRNEGQQAIAKARELAEKLGTDQAAWPEKDRADYDALVKTAQNCLDCIKRDKAEDALDDQIKAMFPGDLQDPKTGGPYPPSGAGPLDKTRRLSIRGGGAHMAATILSGQKAGLSPSGAALVSQEFRGDPYELGKPRLTLLDAVPVVTHGSPEYAFLRATTRDNQAAAVSVGALKPTSDYGVTRIEQSLVVIAHVSSTNRMWLLDNQSLTTFLEDEMTYGLQRAVESKILTDVNATSGIQLQPYATSTLATLRKAITKCQAARHDPASFVVHPTDWEGVELALSSTNSVEHQGLPYNPATQALFGVPIVVSLAQAAGVAHLLAVGSVALDTDQRGIDISWSESATADSFQRYRARSS